MRYLHCSRRNSSSFRQKNPLVSQKCIDGIQAFEIHAPYLHYYMQTFRRFWTKPCSLPQPLAHGILALSASISPTGNLFSDTRKQERKLSLLLDCYQVQVYCQPDLKFQQFIVVQELFEIRLLLSCLVCPVDASYQDNPITLHVLT